jgi:hypothetical protein
MLPELQLALYMMSFWAEVWQLKPCNNKAAPISDTHITSGYIVLTDNTCSYVSAIRLHVNEFYRSIAELGRPPASPPQNARSVPHFAIQFS